MMTMISTATKNVGPGTAEVKFILYCTASHHMEMYFILFFRRVLYCIVLYCVVLN